MVFSDSIFLYVFFPLIFCSYFIFKNLQYRNILLLIFSLIFYSWGEPKNIFLILIISFIAYIGGLLIGNYEKKENKTKKKIIFILTITIIITNLLIFKYLNLLCTSIEELLHIDIQLKEIVLPIGISFYTFQILSYVIDLYNNNIKPQKISFFLSKKQIF